MTDTAWRQQPTRGITLSGVLAAEECAAVRQAAHAAGLSQSKVIKGNEQRASKERTSRQARLLRGPETEWLFARMLAVGAKVNDELWRFALTGIENFQVLRYRPMQRFLWHYDSLPGAGRKITCIVNVGEPGGHWRGKLELMASHEDGSFSRLPGSATFFPSYLVHRATAPWWGERWSLVTWLTGPELV